jgi:hypothetical protein
MPQEDDASIKAEIAAMAAGGREDDRNAALWHAVDVLAEETTFASWTGGDIVGTNYPQRQRAASSQMPYPEYAR